MFIETPVVVVIFSSFSRMIYRRRDFSLARATRKPLNIDYIIRDGRKYALGNERRD